MPERRGLWRVLELPGHLTNLELERAVLGVIAGDSARLEVARDILPGAVVFADERHLRIYGAMLRLADAGSGFDPVTLRASLKTAGELAACGGTEYLETLRDGQPRASRLEEYARGVHGLWRQRQAYIALVEIKSKFDVPGAFDDADPVDSALARLSGLDTSTGGLVFMDGPAIARRAMEILKAGAEGKSRGLSTGFPSLDHALGGGMLPGQLIVLGGRPSTGKSAFLENVILNVARERPVCMFSLEMSLDANIERLLAILGGVDPNRIRQGVIAQHEYGRLVEVVETLFASHLRMNDSSGITAHAVRAAVRREQARGGLGLVCIDYLQMMSAGSSSGRRDRRRDQELGDITKALKGIAVDLNVPVIVVASLNRGVESRTGNKRPILSDIRDSGEIESDADVVMFTYRDSMYNPESIVARGDQSMTPQDARTYQGMALQEGIALPPGVLPEPEEEVSMVKKGPGGRPYRVMVPKSQLRNGGVEEYREPRADARAPGADDPLIPRGVQDYIANLKGRGYSRERAQSEVFGDVWSKLRRDHPRLSAVSVQQALDRLFPANDLGFGGGGGMFGDAMNGRGGGPVGAGGGPGRGVGSGPARGGGGPVVVQTPNGPFAFPDQSAADQFRRAAGIP